MNEAWSLWWVDKGEGCVGHTRTNYFNMTRVVMKARGRPWTVQERLHGTEMGTRGGGGRVASKPNEPHRLTGEKKEGEEQDRRRQKRHGMEGSGTPEMEVDKDRHSRWDVARVVEGKGEKRKKKEKEDKRRKERTKC